MKNLIFTILAGILCLSVNAETLQSPNGNFKLTFELTGKKTPVYSLQFKGKTVIKPSKLGLELKEKPSFTQNFSVIKTDTCSVNNSWDPVWGEVKTIRNNYNELAVTLQENESKRNLLIRFRLFNDGLGFRYEFPRQGSLAYFTVTDENTEFALAGNHKTFWIPGDYNSNEHAYTTSKLSEVSSSKGRNAIEISTKSLIGNDAVQTPLMMKSEDGLYINIHEAALVDYSAMNLIVNKKTFVLTSHLVPDAAGNKAYMQTPCKTPWRTIIVSDKAADILESKIVLNLNEPSKISDASWIKPQKFVGVWWEMHVDKSSWNYSDERNTKLDQTDWKSLKPNGRHGATTERVKKYIDFAAQNGIQGVLVEGWNIGWEDWFGNWKENVFDFVTPYPDFNVEELSKYAAEKGVKLIMHHETSASATNYERRMDDAYAFMKKYGYDAVKTGYVGRIIPRGENHDGQWMINHYIRVAEKTAQNHIMLDAHEPVRPTGLHRTYPNWLACEAARGNEFNAWSEGNAPDHETILPFTRLIGGPMDYTPGIFEIKRSFYQKDRKEQVHTTIAKQLALYVTMYSPLQMAADLPENYEKRMDAFQFIKDVAVDWDDTKIIEAEPGDYLTIARKAKNSEEWYIGGITDENSRTAKIDLSFLNPDKTYTATIYADAKDADWKDNPMSYQITKHLVTSKTQINQLLVKGGGVAISIKPSSRKDIKDYKKY